MTWTLGMMYKETVTELLRMYCIDRQEHALVGRRSARQLRSRGGIAHISWLRGERGRSKRIHSPKSFHIRRGRLFLTLLVNSSKSSRYPRKAGSGSFCSSSANFLAFRKASLYMFSRVTCIRLPLWRLSIGDQAAGSTIRPSKFSSSTSWKF